MRPIARRRPIAAARYVELNPVRARLAKRAADWAWSSARAHAAGRDDALVTVKPLLDRVGRGADLIGIEPEPSALVRLRGAESSGRPLGADDFLKQLERRLGRPLRPRKPGPKPHAAAQAGSRKRELRKWVSVTIIDCKVSHCCFKASRGQLENGN